MGMDILIIANNNDKLMSLDYYDEKNDYFNKHNLSRTFCNFMSRPNVISGEPELDQIGKITRVDISCIYDMEKYLDDDSAEHYISFGNTKEEREKIKNQIQADKDSLSGNIEIVLTTVTDLIKSLSQIDNLNQILDDNGDDTLDNDFYFSDFNIDKGQGYIGNNFGQDLRNFQRFLEYAKTKGTTTVWFNYG